MTAENFLRQDQNCRRSKRNRENIFARQRCLSARRNPPAPSGRLFHQVSSATNTHQPVGHNLKMCVQKPCLPETDSASHPATQLVQYRVPVSSDSSVHFG